MWLLLSDFCTCLCYKLAMTATGCVFYPHLFVCLLTVLCLQFVKLLVLFCVVNPDDCDKNDQNVPTLSQKPAKIHKGRNKLESYLAKPKWWNCNFPHKNIAYWKTMYKWFIFQKHAALLEIFTLWVFYIFYILLALGYSGVHQLKKICLVDTQHVYYMKCLFVELVLSSWHLCHPFHVGLVVSCRVIKR